VLSGDAISMLDSSGIPLGIEKNLKLLVKNIELKKGDRLFLYTDGLIEIDVNNQKDLRFDILTKEIIATKQIALDDAVQKIIGVVTSQNKTLDDDIAVIALEIC
jgi:sigma-B regulation protein RsbU (phosphoserine phosphatase)